MKILKYILILLLSLISSLILYVGISFLLTYIPVKGETYEYKSLTETIYLNDNGVHVDIIGGAVAVPGSRLTPPHAGLPGPPANSGRNPLGPPWGDSVKPCAGPPRESPAMTEPMFTRWMRRREAFAGRTIRRDNYLASKARRGSVCKAISCCMTTSFFSSSTNLAFSTTWADCPARIDKSRWSSVEKLSACFLL